MSINLYDKRWTGWRRWCQIAAGSTHMVAPANLDAGRDPRWAALAVAALTHHVAITPPQEVNEPLAAELHAALAAERSAATVVPALLGVWSIFDGGLAADATFAGLLTHWCGTIQTDGPDGLRKEITHG